ncbi:MAG: hypothetical protein IPK06_02275 [Ignavibacteriae bacterium]|nr:hypothetical protein [Ignavibacteriota bacterium]
MRCFGSNYKTDAYFVANSVPSLFFLGFYTTIAFVFLPLYNERRLSIGKTEADKFANNVITFYAIISLFLSIVGVVLAPKIISLIAPAFDFRTKTLAINLTRIVCLSFVFNIIVGIFSSLQYVNKRYFGQQVIHLINNLMVLLSILIFAKDLGIYIIAISGVLSWVIQIPIQKYIFVKDFKYKINLNFNDTTFKKCR